MAGDWIKMRSALLSNPKVHTIARLVGECREASRVLTTGASCPPCEVLSRNALRNVTVTALLLVWSSANEHTSDGVMRCCDLIDVDEIAGIPGFGEAMQYVGWAQHDVEKDAIILPNFTEWNTPAKDRTAAERQRRFREKRNGPVTRDSNGRVRGREELEEKEEPPISPNGGQDEPKPVDASAEPQPQEPPPHEPPQVPPEEPVQFPESVSDVCEAWLDYKRQRREGYKPRGLKSFATTVEKAVAVHGAGAVRDALEQAMSDNYQGWTHNLRKPSGNGKAHGKPVTFAQQAQSNVQQMLAKAAADDAAAGRFGTLAGFLGDSSDGK
jgi:hypothetical protein